MKKRIMVVAIIAIVAAGSASAAFDGLTSVGLNYEFRDGVHMGGLSSQTFGYVDNCPVGYLVSVDADFNLGKDSMAIGMLVVICSPTCRCPWIWPSGLPSQDEISKTKAFSGSESEDTSGRHIILTTWSPCSSDAISAMTCSGWILTLEM